MRLSHAVTGFSLLGLIFIQGAIAAPMNLGPPTGPIFDLATNGSGLTPSVYTQYSVSFVATSANTDLTFALRNDPGYFALDDISMIDTTTASGNLVTNGDFEAANTPTGWGVDNIYGATFAGFVDSSGNCGNFGLAPHGGTNDWCDGSVQAYDAIDQVISTTIGDSYTVSFWLIANPGSATAQQLSTNGNVTDQGGNGMDVLVYAQSGLPTPSPEPGTIALFATGLAGLPLLRRRMRRQ